MWAGVNHFRAPDAYVAIMPPALPRPLELVYLSGVAEIVGGIGVMWPRARRMAGWGLILLLIAVFPANVYALMNGMKIGETVVPTWALWARLPLQGVLMWWVWAACLQKKN